MVARILARPVAWIIGGAILFCLIGLTVHSCTKASQAGAEASLATEAGKAGAASGSDAVNSVGGAAARDAATDMTTMENADAIQNADGADAPVNPSVRDAGFAGLCKRTAYRCTEQCLQRVAADRVADARARCAAS